MNSDALVLFINDDVRISKDFLYNGISILEKSKNTLLLAQIIDKKTEKPMESGVMADVSLQRFEIAKNKEDINCLSTRGLMLRYSDLINIGGFFKNTLAIDIRCF